MAIHDVSKKIVSMAFCCLPVRASFGAVLNQIPRKRGFYYGGYRNYDAPYYEYTGRYYLDGKGANGQKARQRQGPLQWALNRLRGTTD